MTIARDTDLETGPAPVWAIPGDADTNFPCRDCGSPWTSKSAADECEILDAVEAKQARREKG